MEDRPYPSHLIEIWGYAMTGGHVLLGTFEPLIYGNYEWYEAIGKCENLRDSLVSLRDGVVGEYELRFRGETKSRIALIAIGGNGFSRRYRLRSNLY